MIQAVFNGNPKSPIPSNTAGLKNPPDILPTATTPMATIAPIATP